jgi:predicted RNase H-like HicB family nuclease
MSEYRYTAVFEPAEEGGYTVTVPALPGLVTEGDTFEEARNMVEDAIRGYLEALAKNGEEIPVEHGEPITQRVAVNF